MADASSTNLRAGRFTAMPDIMPTMDAAESEGTMSDLTLERFKSYSADFVSIDRKVIKRMGRREKELKRMHSSQKALSLLSGIANKVKLWKFLVIYEKNECIKKSILLQVWRRSCFEMF